MPNQDTTSRRERRTLEVCELRAAEGDGRTLTGYAAVFNERTRIGSMFEEVIRPGAFTRAIGETQDVRALVNHDSNFVLGRTKAGTLELAEDERGLKVTIDPPRASWADDLLESVRRGDVDQMSFAFWPTEERWNRPQTEGELDLREILAVDLYDVSVVTFPQYESTSVGLRSAEDVYQEHLETNATEADPPAAEDDEPPAAHEPAALVRRAELELASD